MFQDLGKNIGCRPLGFLVVRDQINISIEIARVDIGDINDYGPFIAYRFVAVHDQGLRRAGQIPLLIPAQSAIMTIVPEYPDRNGVR